MAIAATTAQRCPVLPMCVDLPTARVTMKPLQSPSRQASGLSLNLALAATTAQHCPFLPVCVNFKCTCYNEASLLTLLWQPHQRSDTLSYRCVLTYLLHVLQSGLSLNLALAATSAQRFPVRPVCVDFKCMCYNEASLLTLLWQPGKRLLSLLFFNFQLSGDLLRAS